MTALERTQQAELGRWVQAQHGPVYVVERVVVERTVEVPVARPSTWAGMTPEARFAAIAVIALGVLAFMSLFALAGAGGGASTLFVGLVLGFAAAGALVAVLMWRTSG